MQRLLKKTVRNSFSVYVMSISLIFFFVSDTALTFIVTAAAKNPPTISIVQKTGK